MAPTGPPKWCPPPAAPNTNALAHYSYGVALASRGRLDEARDLLVQRHQLGQRRHRDGIAPDGVARRLVAQDQRVGRSAMDERKRHARVAGVDERPLAFDQDVGFADLAGATCAGRSMCLTV